VSRLDLANRVPEKYEKNTFSEIVRLITGQLNRVSEGKLSGRHNAQASAPVGTATAYAVGDFVPDSNCTVRGSIAPGLAASYVRIGWVCVAPGTPGTFVEERVLTGT
jgi:hypothetical protein